MDEEVEGGREIHEHEENEADKKSEEPVVKSKNRSHQQTQSLHLRLGWVSLTDFDTTPNLSVKGIMQSNLKHNKGTKIYKKKRD